MDIDETNAIPLDGFEVVAIPGEGVWVADQDGNCWHVGGPNPNVGEDNKLVRAYRRAVGD